MKTLLPVLLSLLVVTACSKPEVTPVGRELAGAATAPLTDLNLLKAKIPEVLLAAQQAPYAPPTDPTCEGLGAEIKLLDAALGADLDAPPGPEASLLDKGRSEVHDAAVGAVKSSAEALIPFRGWLRKLSGAEKASRQVTKAIAAGIVRRAYLKGLGQAKGCPPPSAPALASPLPRP
jgi:hypothetical protein